MAEPAHAGVPWLRPALALLATLAATIPACASQPPARRPPTGQSPIGLWLTEDRGGIVRIEPCGAALCGIIVGLSEWPANGQKLDIHGRSQCHLTLLAGLLLHPDGSWHGTVTNPEDGRTYSAEVWVPHDGTLRLRGYVGLPMFGSTQLWPPYHGSLRPDCHFP